MYAKLVKLGSILGCHQRTDRSFRYNGYQIPICARCLGLYGGYFIGIILAFFISSSNIYILLIFVLATYIDGTVQLLTKYESNNYVRLTTGLVSGIASVLLLKHIFIYWIIL